MQLDQEQSEPNVGIMTCRDLLDRSALYLLRAHPWYLQLICNTFLTLTRHPSEDSLKTVVAWKYTGSACRVPLLPILCSRQAHTLLALTQAGVPSYRHMLEHNCQYVSVSL